MSDYTTTIKRHSLVELEKRIDEMKRTGWTLIRRGTEAKEFIRSRNVKHWAVLRRKEEAHEQREQTAGQSQ
jgi:hypothetical protein